MTDRRRPSPHLAAGRSALAGRADAAAHLRPLRADPARLSDRANISPISPAPASSSRSTCRPTGPNERSRTRRPGCSETAERAAGRTRIVAYADFGVDDVRPQLDRLAQATRWCAACGCNCTGTKTRYTASPRGPTSAPIRRSGATSRGSPTMAGASICRYSRRRWRTRPTRRGLPEGDVRPAACRHAEDLSPRRARRTGAPAWRGSPRCPNVVSKLSGLGTFIHRNDPAHIAEVVARDRRDVRRRALPVRLEFPDREALDQLSRARRRLSRARGTLDAPSSAMRSCTTRRCGFIGSA